MAELEFSQDDVIAVAKALVSDPLVFMSGDFISYYICDYCAAHLTGYDAERENFKHETGCPVLVAQDILTGLEG